LFAHTQKGSSKFKMGDSVKQGQEIAAIGASGSSKYPHLHYELRTNADHTAEGLPSYFSSFKKLGKQVKKGQIDTGDIVEN
jgi:murein DD-endopeptidase MepM/ murein hydrolase activator NlpD